MIQEMTGNMFLVPAKIRINTVNCEGVMGKGIAKLFKERYPLMFDQYKLLCDHKVIRPGTIHVHDVGTGEIIYNFATKDSWRYPSQLKWIDWGLRQLALLLIDRPGETVTLPALGCGNGGLPWPTVRALIHERLFVCKETNILLFQPQDSR
jgi:O-acetyl-ADP-ribose deacetylase (regulator of RNase III)